MAVPIEAVTISVPEDNIHFTRTGLRKTKRSKRRARSRTRGGVSIVSNQSVASMVVVRAPGEG